MDYQKIKKGLKRNRLTAAVYRKLQSSIEKAQTTYHIAEIQPIHPRMQKGYEKRRLNLLVPSLNIAHVFGGIATALKFYKQLGEALPFDLRVVIMDSQLDQENMVDMENFSVVPADIDSEEERQILSFADREGKTLPVGCNDIFMATGWWTAYVIAPVIRWQRESYGISSHTLLYFIQDYEPGFYPWSSRYLMADSTYKLDIPTIGVFNSSLLYQFFKKNGYQFHREYYFEPVLNEKLKQELLEKKEKYARKKQIILYGRPGTARNAFELILASLNEWADKDPQAGEWTILSAGEAFDDITLHNGQLVHALGKVSLEEYARLMLESRIGISLMVSPHPSYPPLEMASFGMKVITNQYDNKDLSRFHANILSLDNCSSSAIARKLQELCSDTGMSHQLILEGDYFEGRDSWAAIIDSLKEDLL